MHDLNLRQWIVALWILLACAGLARPDFDDHDARKLVTALRKAGYPTVQQSSADAAMVRVSCAGTRAGWQATIMVSALPDAAQANLLRTTFVAETRRKHDPRLGTPVFDDNVPLAGTTAAHLFRWKPKPKLGAAALAAEVEEVFVLVVASGELNAKDFKRLTLAAVGVARSPHGGRQSPRPAPAPRAKQPRAERGAAEQPEPSPVGCGTGFYVTPSRVLTNAHVAVEGSQFRLTNFERQTFRGWVVARGRASTAEDLALLEVERAGEPLALATSTNLQRVYAYGFGSLGGMNQSLLATEGRISGRLEQWLVTSAHINPGNSGGPLVDASGRVVGVVVAKTRPTSAGEDSLGLAIPTSLVREWALRSGETLEVGAAARESSSAQAPDDAVVRRSVVRIEILR